MIRMRRLTTTGSCCSAPGAKPGPGRRATPLPGVRGSLPVPTVSKILNSVGAGGAAGSPTEAWKGGFSLASASEEISMAQIISAMKDRIAITECSDNVPGICELEPWCPVGATLPRP